MNSPLTQFLRLMLCAVLAAGIEIDLRAQADTHERAFPQSKAAIEKALPALQSSVSGRLPVLDGFAKPGEHPLDRYERGFFQSTIQVTSASGGGSVVRVITKVTAWYRDPSAAHSGYQLLISNGRIEADILDQLEDQLAKSSTGAASTVASASKPAAPQVKSAEPAISAPGPKFPDTRRTFSSSLSQGLQSEEHPSASTGGSQVDKATNALQSEADSLEEILKNQGHPKNLIAVKKSGTPVLATPSLTAKPQFLASLHDEFEMLDFNADWVHVRISGLSRGWIWRNSVEMPDGIADSPNSSSPALPAAADLFRVIREENAQFPGDWAPLRNKSVKIISVQPVDEKSKDSGAKERMEFAKFLFEKNYKEIAQKPQDVAGIVVIFDSADGGMIAATTAALQQWKAGTLSDSALWHKCFFDPPETFDSSGSSGGQ
jgi:hypothetical protein